MNSERFWNRTFARIAALGCGAILLSGCPSGQTSPPSPEQVEVNLQYFELDGVEAANGESVRCVMYASDTDRTQESKSWFAFSCDFEGDAQFPGEK